MSNNDAIHPEDILPDGLDTTFINGKVIRKGTVAAFLANVDIVESDFVSEFQKQQAMNRLKELAEALVIIGLHKHVIFKNPEVEQILVEAAN